MSAMARWRPGERRGAGAIPLGRATAVGALTVLKAPTSVPWSVGRTGRYWPDGHHAHVSSATSAVTPAKKSPRRGALPALQPHALRPLDSSRRLANIATPATGRASANRRASEASTPRTSAPATWSGIADARPEPLAHADAASFGNSRMALKAMASRIGTMIRTHAVTRTRAQPFSADGSRF